MKLLPNAAQMRAIDQCAINHFGIPGIVLMENAGLGTVLKIEQQYGPLKNALIPIFIGPGNNGGDGLVIARHLLQRQAQPLLIFLIEPDRLKGDSAANLAIVSKLNIPACICCSSDKLQETAAFLRDFESTCGMPLLFVDAIFGTGLQRAIEGHFRDIIALVNDRSKAADIPIVSVDIPSGLDSDSGRVNGICINAAMTATYGYAKIGQMMPESSRYTGSLHIVDIGIPAGIAAHVPVSIQCIDHGGCAPWLKQLHRSVDSHKGSFGHLLIIGGSAGKTGAAILTGRGALRSGCGLVSLFCSENLNAIYESVCPEMMTIRLESIDTFKIGDLESIQEQIDGKGALVIGPGIGQDHSTTQLVIELYNHLALPMVVDADALNIIAANRELLHAPPAPRILTPHPGEMARLISTDTATVQNNRIDAVNRCLDIFDFPTGETVVILKGAATIVADRNHMAVNTTGNPSMAAGGMGDVLSGMIGSFLCQGLSPFDAACFSVFVHGSSGDRLLLKSGGGFSASELADGIGKSVLAIKKECVD